MKSAFSGVMQFFRQVLEFQRPNRFIVFPFKRCFVIFPNCTSLLIYLLYEFRNLQSLTCLAHHQMPVVQIGRVFGMDGFLSRKIIHKIACIKRKQSMTQRYFVDILCKDGRQLLV